MQHPIYFVRSFSSGYKCAEKLITVAHLQNWPPLRLLRNISGDKTDGNRFCAILSQWTSFTHILYVWARGPRIFAKFRIQSQNLCHPCRISSSFFDFSGKIKKVNWLVVKLDGEMEKWVTSKFKTERGLQK